MIGAVAKYSGHALQSPSVRSGWCLARHVDYLFQMAAHRQVLRASLTPFWPGSPHHVSLKSLLRVTLENPKRMGTGGSGSCWTEARKVQAGGIVFGTSCLGSEQVFREGWGGEAALVTPALAPLSG